jgi:hypothetical protein
MVKYHARLIWTFVALFTSVRFTALGPARPPISFVKGSTG